VYTDTVMCRFPGCQRAAQLSAANSDEDALSLCFDHIELLFYDREEYDRLWAELDVDSREAV
jgi:hypothetical protein